MAFVNENSKDNHIVHNSNFTQSVPRKKLQNYSYLLTDAIGKGYSSQVFKGRNDVTKQNVAIKVINMSMLKNQLHQNLLNSEIECLKKLKKNTNIIELYQVYTTKNNTYLITQLCQDGDLSKLIKNKKLSQHKAIYFIQQIIHGYLKIYRQGILHRDIKPANIFLQGQNIKIADFGFAVKIQDAKKNSNYNVGSPLYMPPQAITLNKYSYKSDIWALGIIFYEMLMGKAPWKAKNQQQLAKKVVAEPISGILPPDISSNSIQFLLKTLQNDVSLRMGPQQLQRFTFSHQPKFHIDLKNSSKLNLHEKTQSFLKSSRNLSNPKIDIQTPKGIHILSGQKSIRKEVNTSGFKILESDKGQKFNRKQISTQLLSQIHFCRFLYKLMIRISQSIQNIQSLNQALFSVIIWKLNSLICLEKYNVYQFQCYRQYKQTIDFKKIINIAKQYQQKYKDSIQKYRKINMNEDYQYVVQQILGALRIVYKDIQFLSPSEIQLNKNKEILICLDYMITCYQLMELAALKDLNEFSKKSKIEAIVQGSPCKINYNHLKSIRQKLLKLKIINIV